MWCIPELNDQYIERMEDILALYDREYNNKEPVVCLDEKPVQLLENLRKPKNSTTYPKIKKRDHQYRRKGTANVFCGVEPLSGCYFNFVTKNKKGPQFAKVMYKLSQKYLDVDTIHIVMDNYTTHTKKSLTDYYGTEKGNAIWNRFTVYYTPVNASWLDQAEIAIGLYSRQCLGKERIPDIETLRKKTKAWNKAINRKKVKINWGFTVEKARKKFDYN
jgi:hypothetical protein